MLHIISEHGEENPEQSKLLAALALSAVRRLSAEMAVIGEDDNVRAGWRMARIGDLALLEKPADRSAPRRIDCYLDL